MHLSAWLDSRVTFPMDEALLARMLNQRQKSSRIKEGPDLTFETDHTAGGRIQHGKNGTDV